jgi:DNA polymerase III sliding clamp (beta) subunit (PCNA family)
MEYEPMDMIKMDESDSEELSLFSSELKTAIKQAIPFLGDEETYPTQTYLTRVVIRSISKFVYVYGLTTHQFFIRKIEDCKGNVCTTIHKEPAKAIVAGLPNDDSLVFIKSQADIIRIRYNDGTFDSCITFRTDEKDQLVKITDFVNSSISASQVFITEKEPLKSAVSLAGEMAAKVSNVSIWSPVEDNKVSIQASSQMKQYVSSSNIEMDKSGWDEVCLNNGFVDKAIKAISSNLVSIGVSGPGKPVIFKPGSSEKANTVVLIMPIAL